jgi:hypothetical protein
LEEGWMKALGTSVYKERSGYEVEKKGRHRRKGGEINAK